MSDTMRAGTGAGALPTAGTVFPVLLAISFSHLLNDSIQSFIPALYPILKDSFALSFTQIGLITLAFQITASLLQPAVGLLADLKPRPYSLPVGMGFSLAGLLLLAFAGRFGLLLLAVALVGIGSAVFHPESSRVAYMAAGARRGLAQSVFQVGGNAGNALGPLFAALVVAARGRPHTAWFSLVALLAMIVLWRVGGWYRAQIGQARRGQTAGGTGAEAAMARPDPIPGPAGPPELPASRRPPVSRKQVILAMTILLILVFSKYFYTSGLSSYLTFYLMEKFSLSIRQAQFRLFLFQFAIALGTLIGGPLGDRIGRKYVIWISILGAAPFTILLPHAGLVWTTTLAILIGLVMASSFSAILVYAQELIPGKVGTISGLFFGLAFGFAGIGSAVLGRLADSTSIGFVYRVIAYLPLLGLITGLLPDIEGRGRAKARARS